MGHGHGASVGEVRGHGTLGPAGPIPASQMPGASTGCVIIHSGTAYEGKQGLNLSTGISKTSAGSRALCMHLVVIPPGMRGTPHLHDGHETAIYMAQGELEVWYGPGLASRADLSAGDFLYIPPGSPHLPVNRGHETAMAVVARTDPAEQESVVLLDLPSHLASLTGIPAVTEG